MKSKRKNILALLAARGVALLLSACSGGGGSSGGSSAGTGSSVVEGNVVSLGVAWSEPLEQQHTLLADLAAYLMPVSSAHADSTLGGIGVNVAGIHTTTDANGYFMVAGVPPGTHQVLFSKNGINSSMSVTVGENDLVTMQNISIHGNGARAQRIGHRRMEGAGGQPAGTPAGGQMTGTPGTPGSGVGTPGTPTGPAVAPATGQRGGPMG